MPGTLVTTMIIIMFSLMLALAPSVAIASGGPNEPVGAVKLLESSNDTFPPTGFTNIYPGCDGFAGTDSTAPKSAPGVYIERRRAGTNNPPPSGGCSIRGEFPPVRNIYGAMWYKTSNPYSGVEAGTKLAGYMQQQAGNFVGIGFIGKNSSISTWYNGFFPGWNGNCQYSGQSWFYDPRAMIGEPECAYVATMYSTTGAASSGPSVWTMLEWYFQLGSCGTCNDGIKKVWVNNTPSTNLTNFNFPDSPFIAWGMTHTWDGVNKYIDPSIEDLIITDHMYLSTTSDIPHGVKLPAPHILSPLPGDTVTDGSLEIRFSEVDGARQYILNVHEQDQSYECSMMTFCGNIAGTSKTVKVKSGMKYDWWVQAIDKDGVPGDSQGATFMVKKPVGHVFSNIENGEFSISFTFEESRCPQGNSAFVRGKDTKTVTVTCDQ